MQDFHLYILHMCAIFWVFIYKVLKRDSSKMQFFIILDIPFEQINTDGYEVITL